jgi:transposase InsO family protein
VMHGREKSDPAIVARKPANKAGRPAAEPVERRAGAEGNTDQQSTRRAQNRVSVSQALGRVRQTCRQLPKVGAVCGNAARTVLCGGRPVMGVPTAILSYVPAGEGWLYLAAVRDLATREIVGWSMADHLGADLACDALLMAIRHRQPPRGLIHHSDRGVQGEFKWSSQHLDGGVCDGHAETAFGSVGARRVALARPARGGAA